MVPQPQRDDRILPATRWLAIAIVPFLVVAFVVLYPWPSDTDRWFAWTIRPTMTPMVLGSAYLGGAYFFVRAARARRWHTIKAGFPPVALFASSLGIATLLHWDRFNHDHVAFWLWAGLYFTTPFLVLGVFLANRPLDPGARPSDELVPPAARAAIVATGLAALALGAYLFLAPEEAADMWPWMLTPLTARVMGAVLMLGLAGVVVAFDARWTTAEVVVDVARVMIVAILVAAVRARDELDTSRPLTWMLGVGLVAVLVSATVLDLRMRSRGASAATPTDAATPTVG